MTTTDSEVNENSVPVKSGSQERSFPDPYEIETPEGAEGWEEMYAYHNRFLPTRRAEDSAKTWFRNSLHYPEVSYPFDQVTIDGAFTGTGVTNTRVFALPPAKGLDVRVINGYTYMSTIPSPDDEEQARRAEEFGKRAGYYFENWDTLYAEWEGRVTGAIRAVHELEIPPLSEFEAIERVTSDRGPSQGNLLLAAYHRLLEHGDQIWTLHSEFLNLGYAAYLQFLTLCKEHFPEIDDQTISAWSAALTCCCSAPMTNFGRWPEGRGTRCRRSRPPPTRRSLLAVSETRGRQSVAGLLDEQRPVVQLLLVGPACTTPTAAGSTTPASHPGDRRLHRPSARWRRPATATG
jgi:hypothetical protein